MLLVGIRNVYVYDAHEMTFLSLVANQVALAVDNALNHDTLRDTLRVERERIRDLEASDALLRALMFLDATGEVTLHAASGDATALGPRLRLAQRSLVDEAFTIVDDVDAAAGLVADPPDFWQRVRHAGYGSVLIVRARTDRQLVALNFWSRRPRAFTPAQVPIARRIADHVIVCVAHEQLAEAAREAAEARLRTEQLEGRVRSLSEELDARIGHRCTVGPSAAWQNVLKAATQVAGTGRRRRPLSRRSVRDERFGAGEVPPSASGARISTTRWTAYAASERPCHRGHEPRPQKGDGPRRVP